MSRLKTFTGALTLVLLASCGGSAKKATPVAPPISIATATTAAPSTVGPPTTRPAPTAPSPTAAATTTTMSLQDLEKVVRQAHDENFADQLRCIAAPASCDPTSFTSPNSAARASIASYAAALASKKWIGRQNVSDPTVAVVASVVFNESRTVATLKECLWDTGVAVEPNAGPNGEDVIVDDGKGSFENTVTMVLSDGKWLTSERMQLVLHDGVNLCAGR